MRSRERDPALIWHTLDELLPLVHDARRDLEETAGCDAFVELLEEVADSGRALHDEAEREITEDADCGPGRSS